VRQDCFYAAEEYKKSSGTLAGKVIVHTKLSAVSKELANQDQGVQRGDMPIITLCAMHAVSCHGLDAS
jgi:hypothetical protein